MNKKNKTLVNKNKQCIDENLRLALKRKSIDGSVL